ncbi:MAG: NAD(P)/FAD-dependent oxidoreductase [Halieaceae bacterium]|nr:NAD(P)/FAD-dependent oxidoreductase [Halieaceae bacterium]
MPEAADRAEAQAPPHAVLIIGAGMSGLCMGIKLLERGIDDFLILEKSADVGGTWNDNRYPGAGCDVPSVLYSYSFAPNPGWSQKFSPQAEIHDYFRDCARRFGLLPKLRLNTRVERADWDGDAGCWNVSLDSGDRLRARCLVSALGQLNRPHIPEFPGCERFAGPGFHSARWDARLDLRGKRVAVIGNAASALQLIPQIAADAAQLYVYQRSANYVIRRGNRAYTAWEKWLFRVFPPSQRALRLFTFLRGEWLFYPLLRRDSKLLRRLWERMVDDYRREEIDDPQLAARLTPDYRIGCKRILLSDDYYAAFRRDNVSLVTSPIQAIDEQGVVTGDGEARPVDVIVYATGFETSAMHSAVSYYGEDGISLQEAWKNGAEAYRGVCTSGFPNFFMLYGPNTNLGSNSIIYMVERQVAWTVNCIDKLLAHELRSLSVNPGVQQAYSARMQAELARTVWVADCESWYKNARGRVVNNWPRSALAYGWHMRAPDFADFDLRG